MLKSTLWQYLKTDSSIIYRKSITIDVRNLCYNKSMTKKTIIDISATVIHEPEKIPLQKHAYISANAYDEAKEILKDSGYILTEVNLPGQVSEAVETHPDIFMCKMEFSTPELYYGDLSYLSTEYPDEAIYNVCISGKYFVHNLKITAPDLISWAESRKLKKIHVPQGYTRCNLLPISPAAFITEDMGIWKALSQHTDLDILKISGKSAILPGHTHGFLPGTAGIIRNNRGEIRVLFNGDIRRHPDFNRIKNFINDYNLDIIYIPNKPLMDIGSIICIN